MIVHIIEQHDFVCSCILLLLTIILCKKLAQIKIVFEYFFYCSNMKTKLEKLAKKFSNNALQKSCYGFCTQFFFK